MAKRFFFVSAGILCLALAYHFGAESATAQAPSNPVVAANNGNYVFTANGDVYRPVTGPPDASSWVWAGNVFGGQPIPAQQETFGGVKAKYR